MHTGGTSSGSSPAKGDPMRYGQEYFATFETDRHRGEEQRHANDRAVSAVRVERPSLPARLGAWILNLVRRDHPLTNQPCRLPDGRIGRVAVIRQDGEWTLVCRIA
jgi:hypothetical protein